MSLRSYKELIVWQRSIELTIEIYRLTGTFPKSEMFGICSQMRRASVSVPSNIAEGYSRRNRLEYSRFINIAYASAAELETQMIIAKKLGLALKQEFQKSESLLQEVLRMLNVLEDITGYNFPVARSEMNMRTHSFPDLR